MKSFEQALGEFRSIKEFVTDDELGMLVDELQNVVDTLVNKGDLFRASYVLALTELNRAEDTLDARKL